MNRCIRSLLVFLIVISSSHATDYAIISPLATQSLLLASDQHSDLMVMVGERGHILYSHDQQNWKQASVETRSTLTGVFLLNETTGWAVGHDAVIVKTTDGAKTWQKVFSAVDEEAPLLDLYFQDEMNGIVVGAYGLIYKTKNGGLSWQHYVLDLHEPESVDKQEKPEFTEVADLHFNAIAATQADNQQRLYIAVEAGHLLRSDDQGETWHDLNSPYHGSFFGVLPLLLNDVLSFGLRGHLYRSTDAGNTWAQIETGTQEMLTNATVLSDGRIIVIGLSGTLLVSDDNGHSFSKVNLEQRFGISDVIETSNGNLLLSTDAGIKSVPKQLLSPAN